jgi:two-component system sensor histidine kinase ChvG
LEPFLARFPEAVAAFQGSVSRTRYARRDGHLELSVAVPLERFRRIAGVLIVSRSSMEIDDAVRALRLDIARATLAALLVTVLLSFYLSRAITRPLAKLARAADRIRHGDRTAVIPDLSRRGDEIGELAVSFREMTEALARRVSEIEAFAADVAHELKNPLTSIRSALETLPRLGDEAKRGQLLALVHADIKRIDRLISDIAAASRLDGELARGNVVPIDLARLVEALIAVHPAGAPPLVLDGKPGILVAGQEDRLVQVLRNVIANAISFSPDDGSIRVSVQADATRGVIVIDDDGPGIPPGREEAIFDRFYTERPPEEAFGQHSGLGLSISRQIIAAHDGTIVAQNRLDADGHVVGARFVIDLPRIAS